MVKLISADGKDSIIKEKFDKSYYSKYLPLLQVAYLDEDKMLTARGRLAVKIIVTLLSFIYILGDTPLPQSLTFVSILSVMLPVAIDSITKYIEKKQDINQTNLYDFLYGAGLYIIACLPLSVAVLIGLNKYAKVSPETFASFTALPVTICIIAGAMLLFDVLVAAIQKVKGNE